MPVRKPAKLLRLHCDERDRYEGKSLHEAVVAKCRELKIAGASVFRAFAGYGESSYVHRRHAGAHDQSIVIHVVDTAENVARLLPELKAIMDTGLIALSDVEMIRIQNPQ